MASFSLFRLGRFLRSIFAPATAIIGFSCLLTFIFILYQPSHGPGAKQRLGWQSWDIVSEIPLNVDLGATTDESASGAVKQPGDADPDVDWWNVSSSETTFDAASLPLDVWDPLLPHDTGLSEIEVTTCWLDPWIIPFITEDFCTPSTTKEQDAIRGKWVRVDRNLNAQGLSFQNIHYRRTRRLDIPLISDIRILSEGDTPFSPGASESGWIKIPRTVSPRGKKQYLWYKADKTSREMSATEKRQLITEIDVTYGDDKPWYGFEKLEPPVAQGDSKAETVSLTIRHGVKPPPRAPPLHFSHEGKYKILQIADLHYSVSAGVCRDTPLTPCVGADNITNSLISHVLDIEKPDLIVFTGDQLNGQGTSWDAKSVLAKFAQAVTDRGIPWAAVFGNHDDEDGDTRERQVRYMQGLPYSLVQTGPRDIHGVGNYVLKVWSADPSKTHLLTLYFLDSGAYAKSWLDFASFGHSDEYDWIHQDQIDWFLEESAQISPIERPFTPDAAKDLGGLWERQFADQITPTTRRLAKPNAMMFFHIPLEEAFSAADVDPRTGKALDVGEQLEGNGNAKKQDGFFHKALLQAKETDHRAGGNAREVKVVANGHDHITEKCRRIKGIWNCFGGGGSYAGYGKINFDRRFRVYEISDFGETIRTYKRTEHDEIVDDMVLVGKGAPTPYEGV
ncbi:Metallo-dependent phosphatase [Cristinia sonorae]|uniref:Metallo-dependent phosphatase n=1 Tax=Cristinia sonorae TaxID=1940300 RepID=A0A8K0XT09_9AGAR|nr:Metallo-dependent phosphatase [Cristinia sonorae]